MITRSEFFKLLGGGILLAQLSNAAATIPSVPTAPDSWDGQNDPDWLRAWQAAKRLPVVETDDLRLRQLLAAIRQGNPLTIRYYGGSNAGDLRRISPSTLYAVEGFPTIYLTAHCHERNQPRHFRCDLLEVCA